MAPSQDKQDPPETRGGSVADVRIAEAEARDHLVRLALYRARVHSGRPASLTRLRELERIAGRSEARARLIRAR